MSADQVPSDSELELPTVVPAPIAVGGASGASQWFEANARLVGGVVAAVAVAALGVVGWRYMQRSGAERADRALAQAAASAQANPTASQAALRRVATQHRGTTGGTTATLILAQNLFDTGRYADGIKLLGDAEPDASTRDAIDELRAAGLEAEGRAADANAAYASLARSASSPERKARLEADAARALGGGGTKALSAWNAIADASGPSSSEARVRAGELAAAR